MSASSLFIVSDSTDVLAGTGVDLVHRLRHLLTDPGLDWASALALATATAPTASSWLRPRPRRGPGRGGRRRTREQPRVTGPAYPLAAGAGVAAVAVPVGTPLSGYPAREGGTTGTHHACTTRALATVGSAPGRRLAVT